MPGFQWVSPVSGGRSSLQSLQGKGVRRSLADGPLPGLFGPLSKTRSSEA